MRLAVPIKFKKLHPDAVIPVYKTHGAACVDLVITDIEYLDENKVTVKYGFASEFSDGYKIIIMPRSSFAQKGWIIQHNPGVIDADYRGEWMTKFEAIPIATSYINGKPVLEYDTFPYKVGDRVTQASVEVNIHMKFMEVKELTETIRGEGGFGSTGTK